MNIAIVGATGNVGRKILEVLEKKDLSIENLYLVEHAQSYFTYHVNTCTSL